MIGNIFVWVVGSISPVEATADKIAEDLVHRQQLRSIHKSSAVADQKESGSSEIEEPRPQHMGLSQGYSPISCAK
jgi:hypothetical protein